MFDSDGDITTNDRNKQSEIISEEYVSGLYVQTLPWQRHDELVEKQLELSCINSGIPFANDESCKLNEDPIGAHIAEVNGMFEPEVFAMSMNKSVQQSYVTMAMGRMNMNDVG